MKVKYALDKDKNLTNISEAKKSKEIIYHCVNCEGELRPKKGQIRVHHFAHKPDYNCNLETYLHKLSKLQFKEQYDRCLENNEPFYFENEVNKTCTSCVDAKPYNTKCNFGISIQSFDLTKIYDKIYVEKQHDGFVADILLVSSRHKICLFIEFAVNHVCEHPKINSGNAIVEITVTSESDLSFIKNKYISKQVENIAYHNIPVKQVKGNINQYSTCKEIFESFIVFKSGKAVISRDTLAQTNYKVALDNHSWFVLMAEIDKETNTYYRSSERFKNLVLYALEENINIKSCFACRFYAPNIRIRYNKVFDIFCRKHAVEVENSNIAADCKNFWRIQV